MNILFIGDIVARAGREVLHQHLKSVQEEFDIDCTIANCENAAAGFGVTPKIANELLSWGVDVLTSGNHIWDKKEILPYLDAQPRILRPANYPSVNPGHGAVVINTTRGDAVAVINIQGLSFMPPIDDPFRAVDRELVQVSDGARVVVVDIHAEATAEKVAIGWYLDGKVSAVLGTHTHITTADERILPEGTAYQTDAGMCGDYDSVIGMQKEASIGNFLRKLPRERMKPAEGEATFCGVFVESDPATGLAIRVAPVRCGGRLSAALPA